MYTMNYVDGLIVREKYGSFFIRILKILNFFVHLGIIAIIVFSILTYNKIGKVNAEIDNIKTSIENKRSENKITEVEKEWENYYYKLIAVREILDNNTNYGFIFKDLGIYMPQNDKIVNLSVTSDEMFANILVNEVDLKNLQSYYEYSKILNLSFEKSEYLKKETAVNSVNDITLGRVKVNTLDVKIPVVSRK